MRATLTGSAGPVAGREYDLDQPIVTIGRRDENTVVIKDPTVSRRHAEIRQEGNDFILTDKGSTSGTLVNGETITEPRRLHNGDTVTIGNAATFAVRIELDDAATIAFSAQDLPGAVREQTIIGTPPAAFDPPPPPLQPQPQPNIAAFDARSFADRPRDEPSFVTPPPSITPPPQPPAQTAYAPPPATGPAPAQPAPFPPQQPLGNAPNAPGNYGGAPRDGGDDLDVVLRDLHHQPPPPVGNTPAFRSQPEVGPAGAVGGFVAPRAGGPSMSEQTRAEINFAGPLPGGGGEPQGYAQPQPQAAPPVQPAPPATGGSRRGLVIGLTIAAILLLVAIIIVAFLLFRTLTG